MMTKLPPLKDWSRAPDPNYENRLLYWIMTDVGEYQLKPRRTIKGNRKIYSAWRGGVFISNHDTAAKAARAAAEDFKFTWSTKAPNPRRQGKFIVQTSFGAKILSTHSTLPRAIAAAKRVSGRETVDVWDVSGGPFRSIRLGHFDRGQGQHLKTENPSTLRGTVHDIPSTWTPVMVRRLGRGVQIKMRGK